MTTTISKKELNFLTSLSIHKAVGLLLQGDFLVVCIDHNVFFLGKV